MSFEAKERKRNLSSTIAIQTIALLFGIEMPKYCDSYVARVKPPPISNLTVCLSKTCSSFAWVGWGSSCCVGGCLAPEFGNTAQLQIFRQAFY
jgi:hypothetical protein